MPKLIDILRNAGHDIDHGIEHAIEQAKKEVDKLGNSRAASLAKTKLDEALLWALTHIVESMASNTSTPPVAPPAGAPVDTPPPENAVRLAETMKTVSEQDKGSSESEGVQETPIPQAGTSDQAAQVRDQAVHSQTAAVDNIGAPGNR